MLINYTGYSSICGREPVENIVNIDNGVNDDQYY